MKNSGVCVSEYGAVVRHDLPVAALAAKAVVTYATITSHLVLVMLLPDQLNLSLSGSFSLSFSAAHEGVGQIRVGDRALTVVLEARVVGVVVEGGQPTVLVQVAAIGRHMHHWEICREEVLAHVVGSSCHHPFLAVLVEHSSVTILPRMHHKVRSYLLVAVARLVAVVPGMQHLLARCVALHIEGHASLAVGH